MDQSSTQPVSIQTPTTSPKPIYFYLSIVFFVFGLIALMYAYYLIQSVQNGNEQVIQKNTPTQTMTQESQMPLSPSESGEEASFGAVVNNTDIVPISGMPTGYKEKNTICYRMVVPLSSVLGEDNKCNGYFSTYQSFPLSLKIDAIYPKTSSKNETLEEMTQMRISMGETMKTETLIIDGLPATLIVEKTHPTNGDEMYRLFVDVSSKKYEVSGYPIEGLEFSAVMVNSSERAEELSTFNTIIGSLTWK